MDVMEQTGNFEESSHDHGNCELCDKQEQEIAALQTMLAAAREASLKLANARQSDDEGNVTVEWNTAYQELVNALALTPADVESELAEWEQLAALMRRREAPWIARWQQETGKPNTLPDYGEILAWIVEKAERAEAVVEAVHPLVNLCRQYFDGRDLRVEAASFHEDWPTPQQVIARAAKAIDGMPVAPADVWKQVEALRHAVDRVTASYDHSNGCRNPQGGPCSCGLQEAERAMVAALEALSGRRG